MRIGEGTSPTHLLQVDGIARSTQSTWATSSDRRVKQNVRDISDAMSIIRGFRPVLFDWKAEYLQAQPSLRNDTYGFIAQEVETLVPQMVTTVHEQFGSTAIQDFRVLSTDALIPLLVKAIQEQEATIVMQQAELEDQRNMIRTLAGSHAEILDLLRQTDVQFAEKRSPSHNINTQST